RGIYLSTARKPPLFLCFFLTELLFWGSGLEQSQDVFLCSPDSSPQDNDKNNINSSSPTSPISPKGGWG
ncbi:hypothetical protein, partial [Desulfocicer niacini]